MVESGNSMFRRFWLVVSAAWALLFFGVLAHFTKPDELQGYDQLFVALIGFGPFLMGLLLARIRHFVRTGKWRHSTVSNIHQASH